MFVFSTCDIIVGENGLGFDIRGHNPVFISSVDKGVLFEQQTDQCILTSYKNDSVGGPAANAGLMPGNCILQV